MRGITLIRRYSADHIEPGKGRTIIGRAVPYGIVTEVADGDGPRYREGIRRGAFARNTRAPQHVRLTYTHDDDLLAWIGRTSELTEGSDGLYGKWFVDETDRGEQALYKVRSGQLSGLSVQARVIRSSHGDDGTVWREHAHLEAVALVAVPAYADAVVTAMRSAPVPQALPRDPAHWQALARSTADPLRVGIARGATRPVQALAVPDLGNHPRGTVPGRQAGTQSLP